MTKAREEVTRLEPRFAAVVESFAKDHSVTHGGTKGFGAGALKVNGRIFAMVSSKAEFVVKLPKERVDQMVDSGKGERFDAGRGIPMKEWLVVKSRRANCLELAKEAYEFVKAGGRESLTSVRCKKGRIERGMNCKHQCITRAVSSQDRPGAASAPQAVLRRS